MRFKLQTNQTMFHHHKFHIFLPPFNFKESDFDWALLLHKQSIAGFFSIFTMLMEMDTEGGSNRETDERKYNEMNSKDSVLKERCANFHS